MEKRQIQSLIRTQRKFEEIEMRNKNTTVLQSIKVIIKEQSLN
jgi:hypothetical protein